jgi:molybdate transport system substrate-binding protein
MIICKFIISCLLVLFVTGCDMRKYPEPESGYRPELLIYCGMTMVKPMMEISDILEKEEKCNVKITYGGSGHITRSVKVNKIGDIFFPGKKSYLKNLEEYGSITKTSLIGYNVAGFFVQPGNPNQITSEIKSLLNPKLNVVIGSPDAGSIGKETERILRKSDIFQKVVDNALFMTTDSKGLVQAIKRKEADLVINWRAVHFLPGNPETMDFISLSSDIVIKQPLIIGKLKYSQYPDLAEKFITLATSERGKGIFKKYGFSD